MRKILITGFKHSGTTLLMQLIRAHPQVGWIEFEEGYIEFDKPKEWVLLMATKRVDDMKKYAWGEKLPWGTREDDLKAKRAIGFTKKWLKFFGSKARVLCILRHPLDASASGLLGKKFAKKPLEYSTKSLPKYIDFMNDDKRCAAVVYEELLENPKEKLKSIFEFLNLDNDDKTIDKIMNTDLKFGKINSERAYAFVKEHPEHKDKADYQSIIERVKNKL